MMAVRKGRIVYVGDTTLFLRDDFSSSCRSGQYSEFSFDDYCERVGDIVIYLVLIKAR
jgi:hypothetical protein